MRKLIAVAIILMIASTAFLGSSAVSAQGGKPANDPKRGMIYDGLDLPTDGSCPGGYIVHVKGTTSKHCSHGPDAPLGGQTAEQSVPPVTTPAPQSAYICDGDGVSGNRVQIIYAHGSDVLDNYATYLTSFQTWATTVDWIFNTSAGETGGTRHVRYVHDANCLPVVIDVTLTPTGMSTFANMESELEAQGYNKPGRKYLVYADTHVYCGIGDIASDDQPGPGNLSNSSLAFARVDNACWGGNSLAHELMHTLGGVQLSAPHTSGGWHCTDGWDRMCYSDAPYYPTVQIVCTDTSHSRLFDCGHDDYYSTNPPKGSYLATHWNTANSLFLIGAPQPVLRTDLDVTGTKTRTGFNLSNSFSSKQTVWAKIHVVDNLNLSVSGASVSALVLRPNGSTQCTLSGTTDSAGTLYGSCNLPNSSPSGTWNVRVTGASKASYVTNFAGAATDHNFAVK